MLVLSRRLGEKIIIADNVILTVLEIRPGYAVRLGLEAPADVKIEREEVRALKQQQAPIK